MTTGRHRVVKGEDARKVNGMLDALARNEKMWTGSVGMLGRALWLADRDEVSFCNMIGDEVIG